MTTKGSQSTAQTESKQTAGQLPLRVAILGFGTVGQSVARIIVERTDLAESLQLTHIFNRDVSRKRVDWTPESVVWTEQIEEVFAASPDVVVETVGGVEGTYEWVQRALSQGASVVTANKLLMAAHGPELISLASTHGSQIRFEAAVAGGVPIIDGIRFGLAGDQLSRVVGILNGTCNFILSRMTSTKSMSAVLEEAQRLGYAEADPSSDIDGHDAAAKLVLLAGVSFRRHLKASVVPTMSIRRIDNVDCLYASRLGQTIRQLSIVESMGNGHLQAFVGPVLVPQESSFALNKGAQNFIMVIGRYGGAKSFSGEGAGGNPTATAVVSDLVALTKHDRNADTSDGAWLPGVLAPPPLRSYYLRFVVNDQSGILASITTSLARCGINVDAVLQEPGFPKDRLPFVVTVEPCEDTALEEAMRVIEREDFHAEAPLVMPLLHGSNDVLAV